MQMCGRLTALRGAFSRGAGGPPRRPPRLPATVPLLPSPNAGAVTVRFITFTSTRRHRARRRRRACRRAAPDCILHRWNLPQWCWPAWSLPAGRGWKHSSLQLVWIYEVRDGKQRVGAALRTRVAKARPGCARSCAQVQVSALLRRTWPASARFRSVSGCREWHARGGGTADARRARARVRASASALGTCLRHGKDTQGKRRLGQQAQRAGCAAGGVPGRWVHL